MVIDYSFMYSNHFCNSTSLNSFYILKIHYALFSEKFTSLFFNFAMS